MARLVYNHSSFAPGLKRVLDRLADRLPETDTITPGRLAQTRGKPQPEIRNPKPHTHYLYNPKP